MREPRKRLDPRVRLVWWTVAGLQTSLVSAALASGILLTPVPDVMILPAGLVIVTIAVAVPHLMYRRWRYEIREHDVYLAKGFLFQRRTLVPFDRIQYVENRQGPLDRLFGLTKVIVYTAAGQSGQIPGLAVEEAERIREELSKVAGTTSV